MDAQTNKSTLTRSGKISRFRIGLMFAGVLIAIAVSPFLMQETGAETGFSMRPSAEATIKQIFGQAASPGVEKVMSGVASLFK